MRIAFATCTAWPRGRPDDRRVAAAVGAGFEIWDAEAVDWAAYDRVVIRSVWDYSHRVGEFLEWCDRIGPARLRNTPELIAFNTDKRYLATLPVPTVPTAFLEPGSPLGLERGSPFGAPYRHEIVVKPNVSAGARDTGRFQPQDHEAAAALVAKIQASGRMALVQPYLSGVDSEGETSVVFFGGQLSHVLHKRPVLRGAGVAPLAEMAHAPAAVMLEDDLVTAGRATEPQLALAHAAHAHITERFGTPLYARVDIVPGPEGDPVVIELELTEPNLYLDLVPGSDQAFASAVLRDLGPIPPR